MHPIVVPLNELTAFDLPKVCVVTGRTDGVLFKPVKFQWYPPWAAALVIVNVLIAIIVINILMKRVKGELPFTEQAFADWKKGKLTFGLSFLALLALMLLGGVAMSEDLPALGLPLFLASFAAPIVAYVKFLKGRGVSVKKIDKTHITLMIPNADAAAAISAHLNGRISHPMQQVG